MPWFGDINLAADFATAAGNQFGGVNNFAFGDFGPLFAFGFDSIESSNIGYRINDNSLFDLYTDPSQPLVYAEASLVPPDPVPAPLPIAGAAVVFGMGRRIRSNSKRLSALSAKR